jgi:hypothetical protein
MNRHFLCSALLASLLCVATGRADTAPADTKVPAYVLKNRSAFTPVADDHRAPFWPIGWVKRKPMTVASAAPALVVEAPKIVLDAKNFKVTSILLGSPALAIINGRTYSEGEFLRTPRAAVAPVAAGAAPAPAAPRIRLYRINDGSVALQCQEQIITVALQRPELAQRKADAELLLEDRP